MSTTVINQSSGAEKKHTPGPWKIDSNDSPLAEMVGDSFGNLNNLCLISSADSMQWQALAAVVTGLEEGGGEDEAKANAHLIAAAPELLEALKRAAAFIGETYDYKTGHTGAAAILDASVAAIAKAEAVQS